MKAQNPQRESVGLPWEFEGSEPEPTRWDTSASAEEEHRHHNYAGNAIPWYVHALWILFWCFAVYYVVTYLFPALRLELLSPP